MTLSLGRLKKVDLRHVWNDEARDFTPWLAVELWRIGESNIAPEFNVTSKPNEWTRSVTAAAKEKGLTDTKLLQVEYWRALREYMQERDSHIATTKALPQYWMNIAIGRSGCKLAAEINSRDNRINVALTLSDENAKAYFAQLYADKEAIETEAGVALQWDEKLDKKS